MRLETDRLIIREWEPRDRDTYAAIVMDPVARRFYFDIPTREQVDAMLDRFIEFYQRDGFGFLPVERKSDGVFLGDVGLIPIGMPLRGSPPVEIGWFLGKQYWGQGYAPEAARAWIDYAFNELNLPEVVAWTTVTNLPSQRVMQKLGMRTSPEDDFIHPKAPPGHALGPHVLYRISRPTGSA
ncbi:MAG: GNAT family N-acetyltransferase [Devosia sp.]